MGFEIQPGTSHYRPISIPLELGPNGDNEKLIIQMMNFLFVCSYWLWSKLIIDNGPLSIVKLFSGLALNEGG